MVKPVVFGIGRLGLRLTVAFLGVALAAIIILSWLTELSTGNNINNLAMQQERNLSRAVAASSGAMFAQPPDGWLSANLTPVLDLVSREGASGAIYDMSGNIVQETSDFRPADEDRVFRTPVQVRGEEVGIVVVKFDEDRGLGNVVSEFERERWRASLGAAGIVALIALVVSLVVSRQITAPVERVMAIIRARGEGDRASRIEEATGAGVLRELSLALNESSDAIDQRDRLQKNLVANIAHELRTPVAILQASHEAMIDGVTQPTTENLWSLRDEVLRLARMIEDLQRLAAAEAAALQLKVAPQDLSEIAAGAAASLADSFGAAEISLTRKLTPIWVSCDADRMREVIVNLLTNALKFTPADGGVILETGPGRRGMGQIQVTDTGVGIPADELPRVTERFFRGQRSAQMATGSGIGLTIVAELVRAQYGHFDITSEQGKGTRVTISVPLAKKPATHHGRRSAAPVDEASRQPQDSAAWG